MPHSSPGSSTTSRSRAIVLSGSRPWGALGSGTCLTVTTIFKVSILTPHADRAQRTGLCRVPARRIGRLLGGQYGCVLDEEPPVVIGRVEVCELRPVLAVQPAHAE